MKTLLRIVSAFLVLCSTASADHVWINEFHYDNVGGDVGEFIEVGFRSPNASGFTAADYVIELYNGSNGALYNTTGNLTTFDTISAAFPIADSTSTITLYAINFPSNGIQNGAPDGLALVNTTNGSIEQFLSYEGVMTATNGSAVGLTSIDIGAFEDGTTAPIGSSLSAMGVGVGADQFGPMSFAFTEAGTPGAINSGQLFSATAVPEPSSIAILGLIGGAIVYRRRNKIRRAA